jgi:hypothetical protein
MGLKNMSIATGATLAVTGGTAVVFADDGVTIPNGVHLVVPLDTNYALRRSATAKYRPPVLDKLGVYTRDKKYISITVPMTLASGKIINNVLRVEREVHPEFTAAEAVDLNKLAAQLLVDTDVDDFWGAGSLS